MTRHQTRRTVSVSQAFYARIAAHCATTGLPERAINQMLDQLGAP